MAYYVIVNNVDHATPELCFADDMQDLAFAKGKQVPGGAIDLENGNDDQPSVQLFDFQGDGNLCLVSDAFKEVLVSDGELSDIRIYPANLEFEYDGPERDFWVIQFLKELPIVSKSKSDIDWIDANWASTIRQVHLDEAYLSQVPVEERLVGQLAIQTQRVVIHESRTAPLSGLSGFGLVPILDWDSSMTGPT